MAKLYPMVAVMAVRTVSIVSSDMSPFGKMKYGWLLVTADAGASGCTVHSRFGTKAHPFSTMIGQLGDKRLDEIKAAAVPEGHKDRCCMGSHGC